MNLLEQIVSDLVQQTDADTMNRLFGRKDIYLDIYGGPTQFTNAIEKKIQALGLHHVSTPGHRMPYIYDLEKTPRCSYIPNNLSNDIDRCNASHHAWPASCDAQACKMIVEELWMQRVSTGKHVGIVGRGHAVDGLYEALIGCDFTLTQCHSKTGNLAEALKPCDIIVYAAPVWNPFDTTGKYVLDVGYSVPKDGIEGTIAHNIGKLTVSIIINRAVTQYIKNIQNMEA